MSEQEIQTGDRVRVTVEGKFHGQEVEVLSIAGRRMRGKMKKAYKLNVTWDGLPRPSYFREDEIEKVEHD